jgi:hypothetical protein
MSENENLNDASDTPELPEEQTSLAVPTGLVYE